MLSAADLYDSNKTIHELVADGFLLKGEDRSQKDLYVQLIDYQGLTELRAPSHDQLETIASEPPPVYADDNIYKLVNQLEIEGNEKLIADAILYINGLPLVVFEFKSAIREDASFHSAWRVPPLNGLLRLPNAPPASSEDGSLRCSSSKLSIRSPVGRSLDYRLPVPVKRRGRTMSHQHAQPGLFIGMDWADQKHDIYIIDRHGNGSHRQLEHSAEHIDAWVGEMLKLAGGQPIAIMLEQSRGALIHALMFREDVLLYPVNPKQLARYRESYSGGGKDDPSDARYLARMLRERIATLTAWQPDDENTRLLANLSQQRRKIVDGQTKLRLQLTALLKSYFPVVLELFGKDHQLPLLLNLLCRWPDPRKLRRADRRLIRRLLSEHSIRNEEQQNQIIERIRSAQLLTRDDALITPSAMSVELLAKQIQQYRKTIEEFDAKIAEAMKRHPDAHLLPTLCPC